MIDYGLVRSTVRPPELVIDEYSAWLNTNIKEIVETMDGLHDFVGFEYYQIQYDKNEFIQLLSNKNKELENQLTDTQIALVELYERMVL